MLTSSWLKAWGHVQPVMWLRPISGLRVSHLLSIIFRRCIHQVRWQRMITCWILMIECPCWMRLPIRIGNYLLIGMTIHWFARRQVFLWDPLVIWISHQSFILLIWCWMDAIMVAIGWVNASKFPLQELISVLMAICWRLMKPRQVSIWVTIHWNNLSVSWHRHWWLVIRNMFISVSSWMQLRRHCSLSLLQLRRWVGRSIWILIPLLIGISLMR